MAQRLRSGFDFGGHGSESIGPEPYSRAHGASRISRVLARTYAHDWRLRLSQFEVQYPRGWPRRGSASRHDLRCEASHASPAQRICYLLLGKRSALTGISRAVGGVEVVWGLLTGGISMTKHGGLVGRISFILFLIGVPLGCWHMPPEGGSEMTGGNGYADGAVTRSGGTAMGGSAVVGGNASSGGTANCVGVDCRETQESRRPDGEPCTDASECAADACTLYFRDLDGDGYGGAETLGPLCGTLPPVGYVALGGDCCDSDPDAHPGQKAAFSMARSGCGGYDYDCNGTEDSFTSTCFSSCSPGCWVGAMPSCGKTGTIAAACQCIKAASIIGPGSMICPDKTCGCCDSSSAFCMPSGESAVQVCR
jgi:hypothetical protein